MPTFKTEINCLMLVKIVQYNIEQRKDGRERMIKIFCARPLFKTEKMKTTFNLLQSSNDIFTDEIVKQISYSLDEEEAGIQKALRAIIPVVLYGLAEKVSTRYGAAEIAQRAAYTYSHGVLQKIDSLALQYNGIYLFLLSDMFGNRSGDTINSISILSGIKHSSVSSLISLALPVVLALMGEHKENNGASETSLAALLIFNKKNFIKNLPLELNLNDSEEDDNEEGYADTVNIIKEKKGDLQGWRTGILAMISLGIFFGWLLISGKSDYNAVTVVSGKGTVQSETKKDSTAITTLTKKMIIGR